MIPNVILNVFNTLKLCDNDDEFITKTIGDIVIQYCHDDSKFLDTTAFYAGTCRSHSIKSSFHNIIFIKVFTVIKINLYCDRGFSIITHCLIL